MSIRATFLRAISFLGFARRLMDSKAGAREVKSRRQRIEKRYFQRIISLISIRNLSLSPTRVCDRELARCVTEPERNFDPDADAA